MANGVQVTFFVFCGYCFLSISELAQDPKTRESGKPSAQSIANGVNQSEKQPNTPPTNDEVGQSGKPSAQSIENGVNQSEKQPNTPPPDDEVEHLLYQIDRDVRKFTYRDIDELLSYEDDTLPYALAERLGNQNNYKVNIRVIKENIEKVKGYLERQKLKKEPSCVPYIIIGIIIVLIIIGILFGLAVYFQFIQFKTEVRIDIIIIIILCYYIV